MLIRCKCAVRPLAKKIFYLLHPEGSPVACEQVWLSANPFLALLETLILS